jgi:hypothetical protein
MSDYPSERNYLTDDGRPMSFNFDPSAKLTVKSRTTGKWMLVGPLAFRSTTMPRKVNDVPFTGRVFCAGSNKTYRENSPVRRSKVRAHTPDINELRKKVNFIGSRSGSVINLRIVEPGSSLRFPRLRLTIVDKKRS